VDALREMDIKAGMLRPITLFPFPSEMFQSLIPQVKYFYVMELNNGQMLDDVRLAVSDKTPVHFYNRMGGNVMSTEEIVAKVMAKEQQS
jgi:2-oxoglutarate ferredoxin oxidoreductase subunit alpha